MPNIAMPHMSERCISALAEYLKKASTYLEFGMGGSTILAAKIGVPNIFSVDSSQEWVNSVTAQIAQISLKGKVQLLYANVGPTGAWGYPLNSDSVINWPAYYSGPWRAVRSAGLQPDLVLVDGRFRVACFLYSLLHLKQGATVLWDDYANRPEYHVVEQFLQPSAYHDEMAVFHIAGTENISGIVDVLFSGLYILD